MIVEFNNMQSLLQRRQWHPTPALLSGKSHGQRSLVGCSPQGLEESDTTEQLHFHFSLSCIGEGNGNPLQRSCLESPRDRGASWAAVYGVAESDTTEATQQQQSLLHIFLRCCYYIQKIDHHIIHRKDSFYTMKYSFANLTLPTIKIFGTVISEVNIHLYVLFHVSFSIFLNS